ncbi:hypothetical protein SUGI_0241440 [Cryptomeria japonica]|nr:hypothetical protein SUGI_0241440 [Cryptomeria japonica]
MTTHQKGCLDPLSPFTSLSQGFVSVLAEPYHSEAIPEICLDRQDFCNRAFFHLQIYHIVVEALRSACVDPKLLERGFRGESINLCDLYREDPLCLCLAYQKKKEYD